MILFLCCSAFLVYRLLTLWPARHHRTRAWWIGAVSALLAAVGAVIGLAGDLLAQKMLALLLLPAGLAWVLLIAATVMAWRSAARRLAWCLTAATALYTLAGNGWFGDALIASLERQVPPIDLDRQAPFDAVFVLGGGSEMSEVDGPQVGSAGDRVVLAARLWHAGKAGVLVVSGNAIAGMERERDLRDETSAVLSGLGVDARAIRGIPTVALNTTQEMRAYAELIRTEGWTRVGLVTSAWHLPRALRLAAREGISPVPLGADRRGRFRGWSPYWLVPQDHGFDRVHRACWEYLGMLIGR